MLKIEVIPIEMSMSLLNILYVYIQLYSPNIMVAHKKMK